MQDSSRSSQWSSLSGSMSLSDSSAGTSISFGFSDSILAAGGTDEAQVESFIDMDDPLGHSSFRAEKVSINRSLIQRTALQL